MGKLGKETKTLLIAITAICLVSFLLAGGIATLLAKNFQQELLLHDYGVAGHLLNNESELSISAFTSQSNENDIERGKEAFLHLWGLTIMLPFSQHQGCGLPSSNNLFDGPKCPIFRQLLSKSCIPSRIPPIYSLYFLLSKNTRCKACRNYYKFRQRPKPLPKN